MTFQGNIKGITVDFLTGDTVLTVATSKKPAELQAEYEELKEKNLDIDLKVHREKRSLNANAYFHVLVGKIADKLALSKIYAKNYLICRYGQAEASDEGIMTFKSSLKPEVMYEQEFLHCIADGIDPYDADLTIYKVYRGSHTYDTKEMSLLIDGTVQEAKSIGIETLSDAELERLKANWK